MSAGFTVGWVRNFLRNVGLLDASGAPVADAVPDVIHVRDVKTSGTEGGTFSAGAWQTRTLNTITTDTGNHATLSSNQVTLPAGTYALRARAPAYRVNPHKLRWRNVTDSTTVELGSVAYNAPSSSSQGDASLWTRFTIGGSKTFELQHHGNTSQSTNGFGVAAGMGESEIYAEAWLEKVA